MSLLDTLLDTVIPHNCLSCNREGQLLCGICITHLTAVPERCYRCQKPSNNYLTCPVCRPPSRLLAVKVTTTGATLEAAAAVLEAAGARRIEAAVFAQA